MGTFHLQHPRVSAAVRGIWRGVVCALACVGGMAVVLVALQFTQVPWKAYSPLSCDGGGDSDPADGWMPTHILVLGGSGVPGESGLMRLWYAADAAGRHPGVPVWIALPCADAASEGAADAYAAELRLRGIEAARCEARACGNNTREQAVALVRNLADGGAGPWRVLLVTSPEHVRRACLAVRRAAKDAGAGIEVRGVAAVSLSVEDHAGEAGTQMPVPQADETGGSGTPAAKIPESFRYSFWNHARYTLDAARECSALLYYRIRGWI